MNRTNDVAPEETDGAKKAEESLRKKFRLSLFSKFTKAIKEYDLIRANDKIAVCMSGGKDSFLLAKLFQELQLHNKVPFGLEFLVMDPGYSPANRQAIENNAARLNIPVHIFETDIFGSVYHIEKSPCYLCARMRRGHLYHQARDLGCNKIALGHHYDDVIETILMGMLYGGQVQTMMPKLKSTNFEGMELIRPMFLQCACKFTENCASCETKESASKRKKVKELIAALAKEDPEIEQNIFKSVENVTLKTVIAYKDEAGVKHRFTDDY